MAWKPDEKLKDFTAAELDDAGDPPNFDRAAAPAAQLMSEQRARRPRVKGHGAQINPNQPLVLPSGKSVEIVLKRLRVDECRVWRGNQRDFEALTPDDVADILPSVQATGVTVPVVARMSEDGIYELIDGSRRFYAATIAKAEEIPAYVADLSDQDCYYLTALYNNYEKPSFYELGRFIQRLRDEDIGAEGVKFACQYLGIDERKYYRVLQIVSLPEYILRRIEDHRRIPLVAGSDLAVLIEKVRAEESEPAFQKQIDELKGALEINKFLEEATRLARQILAPAPKGSKVVKGRATTLKNAAGQAVMKVIETPKGNIRVEFLVDDEKGQEMLTLLKKRLGCQE